MKKEYIECGRIIAPHGVKGLVKVESWCDSLKVLATRKRVYILKNGEYIEYPVISASAAAGTVIMNIGVDSRESAQAMKGIILYLKREDIPVPRGAALISDMIDLPVIDVDTGKLYGILADVSDVPQGKLYEIKTDTGTVYLPERPEFVKKIDIEKGIFVKPIPGFFD
ncbi:MAG: 16S rRNA processing protein RimM [Clostridia bacterium]|nr:16S rRNA processing protein RimM [Clostridia bacterium]